ncbi:DUF429 domain-containing protein [Streptosporangium sp. NPDC051023]|uniref:DUF429 domain-containing protein n=1 Tax=Streptosporangium sp. NPDC051023 TaxID=3155410 RepID=UPI00344C42EB
MLGVDGCKKGWVGVALGEGRVSAYFAARIGDLVSRAEEGGALEVVAVDIPIGLPDSGRRQADVLARREVGPRWQSVFMTPTRAALEAADHTSAIAINRRLAGEGVSRQAFALKKKLLEVDLWVHRARQHVVEVHPELCFARLAGAPLPVRKTTWAGVEHRRALLADAGIVIAGDIGLAGVMAGVDDVFDAAVAAWTAQRVAVGQARSVPCPPQVFGDGLSCAIWA